MLLVINYYKPLIESDMLPSGLRIALCPMTLNDVQGHLRIA